METVNKRYRIQDAAMQLFQEQGIESTSVNEIVKKANVAKGTFYVYYKDKQELIAQILTKKHGNMMNDIMEESYQRSVLEHSDWVMLFIEEMVSYFEKHVDILRMTQKNIEIVMDTDEHRALVMSEIQRLDEFLLHLQQEDESPKDAMNRFLLVLQMTGFICFNAILYQLPDTIEHIKPLFMDTMHTLCKTGGSL